jgi:two-component system sensor histidine kinase ChiS
MRSALACWEHDLGKTKLDLAEESKIWPVYIDKSTPTTRTLDKYLHTDSCPKNPRNQRVIDTAEFVLKKLGRKTTVARKQLQQALDDFRLLISGMKSTSK